MDNQAPFKVYKFSVDIQLRREADYYNSDLLTHVSLDISVPLDSDTAAKHKLIDLVSDELERAADVVDARVEFERQVQVLTSGETVDSTATEDDGD